jgi:MFS family permease
LSIEPPPPEEKDAIRRSLRASTLDGVFATIFSNITGGVLLSNFLVELDATPTEIGLLSSIPLVANLLQPIGALIGDRTNSRHNYCLWVYGPARLLWLILFGWIVVSNWHPVAPKTLVYCTLAIALLSSGMGAFGSASWLSWLAALVPRRLRGRYFGIRNSAASLTNLVSVPLLGLFVSVFPGGSIQGFGLLVLLGVVAGMISLGFQFLMVDVNPQVQQESAAREVSDREPHAHSESNENPANPPWFTFLQDGNFLRFLLYFGTWMFAVNLSAPFFNIYMLDTLEISIRSVTLYNSLQAGANLLLLLLWGKLADRVGNRFLLLTVGILVAITPLLWLGTDANLLSVWLWFPLLHILAGGTWSAIDLCNNNLQLGVAPVRNQSSYFAIAAAVAGVSGAVGTTAGGFLAEFAHYGGIPGVFALSAVVRLVALLPLVFVHEQRGQSLRQMMRTLFPPRSSEPAQS